MGAIGVDDGPVERYAEGWLAVGAAGQHGRIDVPTGGSGDAAEVFGKLLRARPGTLSAGVRLTPWLRDDAVGHPFSSGTVVMANLADAEHGRVRLTVGGEPRLRVDLAFNAPEAAGDFARVANAMLILSRNHVLAQRHGEEKGDAREVARALFESLKVQLVGEVAAAGAEVVDARKVYGIAHAAGQAAQPLILTAVLHGMWTHQEPPDEAHWGVRRP